MFNRRMYFNNSKWYTPITDPYGFVIYSPVCDGVYAELEDISGYFMLSEHGHLVRYVDPKHTEYIGKAPAPPSRPGQIVTYTYYSLIPYIDSHGNTFLIAFCKNGSAKGYYSISRDGENWTDLTRLVGILPNGMTVSPNTNGMVRAGGNTVYYIGDGDIYKLTALNDDLSAEWNAYPIFDEDNLNFKGYIAKTEPHGVTLHEGEYWYESNEMPASFPVSVHVWNGDDWTESYLYTPQSFDEWEYRDETWTRYALYYWFNDDWFGVLDTDRYHSVNYMAVNGDTIIAGNDYVCYKSEDGGVTCGDCGLLSAVRSIDADEKITNLGFINNKYIAFSGISASLYSFWYQKPANCYISDDGNLWSRAGTFDANPKGYEIQHCIYAEGIYMALSGWGDIWTSSNFITWTKQSSIPGHDMEKLPFDTREWWNGIAYYDNKFLVYGFVPEGNYLTQGAFTVIDLGNN